jgi:class III poly(R)-hydroxyalkanoic acid synthase PhaE subunit
MEITMTESTGTSTNPTAMFNAWMKSVNDLWSNTAASVLPQENTSNNETSETSDNNFWQTGMETWRSIASAMNLSPSAPSPSGDIGTFSEMLINMMQPVFSNVTQMIRQWQAQSSESIDNTDHFKSFSFDTIETDILKVWGNLYDNEFRKFFKAPQLGLKREHHEKVARYLDRFNILQLTMAEFLSFLTIPFKKSTTDFQEKLTGLSRKNELPKDANDYYRMWLKILEGHYMTLFQSPEYIQSLGKTLTASAAYTLAKKELLNDVLQQLSIPSSEQMDAVYKELHGLKKRLKNLEKAVTNS